MLMQNLGEQTKSIMVFSEVTYDREARDMGFIGIWEQEKN